MTTKKTPGIPGLSSLIDLVRGSQPGPAPAPESTEAPGVVEQTYLVVGLGNPDPENAGNRHNIGFMFVDRLAARFDVRFARMQNRALVADARYEGQKLILAKPQTYMNESGQAVAALQRFYKIPLRNLVVAFDDMDLPLGTIRVRPKGGSSGQKGMKSIIQRLGNSQGFPRIRLGIGRPPGRMPPPAYLLQDFSKDEKEILDGFLDEAVDAVLTYVTQDLNAAMNRYNRRKQDDD